MSGVKEYDTVTIRFSGATKASPMEEQALRFVEAHQPRLYELNHALSLAAWDLYTQGGKENLARINAAQQAQLDYTKNPDAFREVARLVRPENLAEIKDPVLKRQLEVLYKTFFWGNQNPALQEEINRKGSELEELYNSFRVVYRGKELSNTDVNALFKYSADPAEVQALWEARHQVGNYRGEPVAGSPAAGPSVAERIIELVKLRNRLARSAGYDNYYAMVLALDDIPEQQLDTLMAKVTEASEKPFRRLKKRIDQEAMRHFKVGADRVSLPWFQATHALGSNLHGGNLMRIFGFDEDAPFKGQDPVPLLEKTANAMGASIQKIIDASDLYYDKNRKGKAQHWFCFGIDSPADVRALENVDPELQKRMGYAFSTSLHEVLGHGLDFSQIDPARPSLLRDHASITTESNAMLIEWLVNDARWFQQIMGLPAGEAKKIGRKARAINTAQLLCNVRAQLATVDFERNMYKLADQDLTLNTLNNLWWEKQHKYLLEQRPAGQDDVPHWARVPHYAGSPAYYHSYFIAEIRRAQVLDYINKHFGHLLTPGAGDYLRRHRADGNLYKWDEIVRRMTGHGLSADALTREFKGLRLPRAQRA